MAKKKDPYSRIQERFVESRLEQRGWDEMDMDARTRVSSRFNMLAQSIEGRGKIARQILGPESTPEQRKALKQRIRKNLPSKSATGPQATNLNPENPSSSSVFAGRIALPADRIERPTTTVQPRTTVKSTRDDLSSKLRLDKFADWAADTKIPIYGDFMGTGIPVARVIRQGSIELEDAATAFKQGEIKEGLKNVAGVGRELAYGALDAALARSIGVGVVKGGAKIITGKAFRGRIGGKVGKVAGAIGRTADKFVGGPVAAYREGRVSTSTASAQTGGARVVAGKVEAVNQNPTVVSTVSNVVNTPASQTAARTVDDLTAARNYAFPQTPSAAKPASATRRTTSTRTKKSKPTVEVKAKTVDVTPDVAVNAPSAPVKAPEIVQPAPVTPASVETPTVLQKTVTPEAFTQPVAAPGSQPTTAPKAPVEIAGPSTAKPKGAKKGGRKKAAAKTEEGVKIEVIKPVQGTPPAAEGVVGGAAPKAPPVASSTPSLPTPSTTAGPKTGRSAKSPSDSTPSRIPTSSVIQPGSNPPVVAGKATAIPKQSGRKGVLKEPEIVSQSTYSDPTGWSKTGTVKKTVYKSQALEQTEQALKPKGVSKKDPIRDEAITELIEGAPGPLMPVPKRQPAKIEFIEKIDPKTGEKLAYPTPEGKKIQDAQMLMNDPRSKSEQTYVNVRHQQIEEYAEATRQERWELSPRRKRLRELREEMRDQPGKKGKSLGDVARDAQKEEMRRMPSQRRKVNTRRKPLVETDRELYKSSRAKEDPFVSNQTWVEQTASGQERVVMGTPAEAAARDPRTIEEIRKSVQIEIELGNAKLQPKDPSKLSRREKNAQKRAQEKKQRLSKQRDPEWIREEQAERIARQKRMEDRARRMDRVQDAATRRRILLEQRAEVRKGSIPRDDSPGLRQTVTFDEIDMRAPRQGQSIAVDQFMETPREIRVDIDESVFNRPAYGPERPAPLPEQRELRYAEKFGPAQMTYEELLKVEASGNYQFLMERTPFSRRVSGGKFVLQEGKSGFTMDSIRSTNVTADELRRLIKSTTRKASK